MQIQYAALPHYEEKYDDFMADSVVLRRRFTPEGRDIAAPPDSSRGSSSRQPATKMHASQLKHLLAACWVCDWFYKA